MKKPYKPNKRDERLQQREENLAEAKLLPQTNSEERRHKAQVIRKLWKMESKSDHYFINNFQSRRTNDLELAHYIETLGGQE